MQSFILLIPPLVKLAISRWSNCVYERPDQFKEFHTDTKVKLSSVAMVS